MRQLRHILYFKSCADEQFEEEGYKMNNERHNQVGSKFEGVSPLERWAKEDRDEEETSFQLLMKLKDREK